MRGRGAVPNFWEGGENVEKPNRRETGNVKELGAMSCCACVCVCEHIGARWSDVETLPCCCALLKEIWKGGNVIGGDRPGPSGSSSKLAAAGKLATTDRKYLPAKR
jgi:hypothetical protein